MKKTVFLRGPKQAHKVLTEVLWPLVKSWLICGGGALVVTAKPETRSLEQNARIAWPLRLTSTICLEWPHEAPAHQNQQNLADGVFRRGEPKIERGGCGKIGG